MIIFSIIIMHNDTIWKKNEIQEIVTTIIREGWMKINVGRGREEEIKRKRKRKRIKTKSKKRGRYKREEEKKESK